MKDDSFDEISKRINPETREEVRIQGYCIEIEQAIKTTLVIGNPESIDICLEKIYKILKHD